MNLCEVSQTLIMSVKIFKILYQSNLNFKNLMQIKLAF